MSDCFGQGPALLSVEEMLYYIKAAMPEPVSSEGVTLDQALDRVLSETVIAGMALPRYTSSAMDGVAFALDHHQQLRLIGQALAGHPFKGHVGAGEGVSITTGAPLPQGCDTVVMIEKTRQHGNDVMLIGHESITRGQNVRYAGEEIAPGACVFTSGTRLGPAQLGMLASLGFETLPVYRRPKVALFSSGDELRRSASEHDDDYTLFDANTFSLAGCLRRWGADIVSTEVLPDALEDSVERLEKAGESADLIITSGGISAGQADLVRSAIERLGEITSWRVAMRPGKPVAFGRLANVPFFGLPGNPVAALVTLMQFVQPLLRHLGGLDKWQAVRWRAITEQAIIGKIGRLDLLRGHYHVDAYGVMKVSVLQEQGSHRLSSLYQANCLVELPADMARCDAGTPVTIQPLGELI